MQADSQQENARKTGPQYWRSLDEWADTPEFQEWVEKEFPSGAEDMNGVNRRHFIKIMASSFALAGAGLTGCRRPEQKILPYSRQPERVIPGIPVYYATSQPGSFENLPLIVETHQNRPTKIEGNPYVAPYNGGTDHFTQASILDLYDPDRATRSSRGTQPLTSAQVEDRLAELYNKHEPTGGQGLAILAEPSTSPTRARLHKELENIFPRMVWAEHTAVDQSNPDKAATQLYDSPVRPQYRIEKAKRILSLDADFLYSEPGHVAHARKFARTRKVHSTDQADQMSRLYSVESTLSLTGSMADHRLRQATTLIPAFTAHLVAEALQQLGNDTAYADLLRSKAGSLDVDKKWISECVSDLLSHKGESLIIAGSHLPIEVHILAFYLNHLLGAVGQTLDFLRKEEYETLSLKSLAGAIREGTVDTLVIIGGNPVYDAPADIDWASAQRRVPEVVRLGYYNDETSAAVSDRIGLHVAAAHYLESWSDGRALDGTVVPVQPMIMPIFGGMQEVEFLARLANFFQPDAYGLVKETIEGFSSDDRVFERFLNDGYLRDSGYSLIQTGISSAKVKSLLARVDFKAPPPGGKSLEVRIIPDAKAYDGRYTNNGWLQECSDPITKLTWENAILVGPKLAKEIGFDPVTKRVLPISAKKTATFLRGAEMAPEVELRIGDSSIRGPLQVQPGLADYTVAVTQGYGRKEVGRVGENLGFDVYPLVDSAYPGLRTGASVALTGNTLRLANIQEHWSMEGRAIIRESNSENFVEEPDFVDKVGMESHSPPVYGKKEDESLAYKSLNQPRGNSVYEHPAFAEPEPNKDHWMKPENRDGYPIPQQWGMSIDLNACTGCNACVIACQAENNIPIVGKEQVIRGREMHWIRLDRYYSTGDLEANTQEIPEDPQVSLMPMACQHCETAPCEQVCPFAATVHNSEGVNVMAYNRCAGTRYCANNCPYKVRRFNFFDWNKRSTDQFYQGPVGRNEYDQGDISELNEMQKNPDVTIRMRGVIEKCTYCLQRIEQGKIAQKVKAGKENTGDVNVPDGMIKTACQQVCPSEAIAFGDISDENTEVYSWKTSPRDYGVLGYLNTRPRTTYMARLRNPNPLMPDYYKMPLTMQEYKQKSASGDEHSGHHGHEHAPAENNGHNGHGEDHG